MQREEQKEWSGKSRGGRFGYLFFVHTIRLLGLRAAYALLALVAIYFIPFAPTATRAIWHYNRQRRRLGLLRSIVELYLHYYTFGQTLIDRIALRGGMQSRFRFEFDNYERFLEIINEPGGTVLIGAHVGCWEAGAGFFGKYGKKINIVMFDAEHEQIKEILRENGRQGDYHIIPVNQGSLEAVLEIKFALDRGEYACFNGDRYLDRTTAQACDFMGGEAHFPIGPFRIASKCRVPVVFYYAMRERGRRYRFLFTEVPPTVCRKSETLLDAYLRSLEALLARYPRQWFNFYPFWNTSSKNNA